MDNVLDLALLDTTEMPTPGNANHAQATVLAASAKASVLSATLDTKQAMDFALLPQPAQQTSTSTMELASVHAQLEPSQSPHNASDLAPLIAITWAKSATQLVPTTD